MYLSRTESSSPGHEQHENVACLPDSVASNHLSVQNYDIFRVERLWKDEK